MTIHPYDPADTPGVHPQQAHSDSTATYDSTWAGQPMDSQAPTGLDRVMGADAKIYVVLAVVLVIWIGVLIVLFRTDRKIDRLERHLDRDISKDDA